MCTGLNLVTKNGKHIFGRSLDVTHFYGESVNIVPRNFEWLNIVDNKSYKTKYACIAMSIVVDNHPFLFDGVNEKGLAGGGLNFLSFAKFSDEALEGKENISASDFVLWALSNFSNLEELKKALKNLVLVNKSFKKELPVQGLHWMFTDLSGKSIVVENMEDGMHIYDNPVGVLTNDPTFTWQIMNLNQYVTLKAEEPSGKTIVNLNISPYGHGLGMCGMPGDYSPAARFVRTVFFKDNIIYAEDEKSGVTAFLNILSTVNIPKGSEREENGHVNYTSYKSAMCQESGTYYYTTYDNRRINAISLFKEDLDSKEIINFKYNKEEDILFQN